MDLGFVIYLVVLIVLVGAVLWLELQERSGEFDGRQIRVRQRSFAAGLLCGGGGTALVLAVPQSGRVLRSFRLTPFQGIVAVLTLGAALFIVCCIGADAWWETGSSVAFRRRETILFAAISGLSSAAVFCRTARGTFFEDGVVEFTSGMSLLFGLYFGVVVLALALRSLVRRIGAAGVQARRQ